MERTVVAPTCLAIFLAIDLATNLLTVSPSPSVGLAQGCHVSQPDGLQESWCDDSQCQKRIQLCEQLRIAFLQHGKAVVRCHAGWPRRCVTSGLAQTDQELFDIQPLRKQTKDSSTFKPCANRPRTLRHSTEKAPTAVHELPQDSNIPWATVVSWEETDFGQSRFGHPDLTNFGQNQFWPKPIWANPILANQIWPIHFWIWCASWWGPEGWGGSPKGGAPKGGRPKISRFFPSPAPIFALFVSLWMSCGILVVFEAPEPSNVRVWKIQRKDP